MKRREKRPQSIVDQALAQFMARSRAQSRGEPVPDPASVGPVAFTRLTQDMSQDQMVEALLKTFKKRGFEIDMDK